jgi:predicted Zn-dependent protease
MKRTVSIVYLAICVMALGCVPLLAASSKAQEEQLGRDYAKEVDQQAKFVEDKAITERVDRIGQALAKIANETEIKATYGSSTIAKFQYTFKVVDDKDVNAFSLPGGHIYVNSGLVTLAESDDEIAGVLAHEIAHSSHHHMMQLIHKQATVDRYVALISLAGILTNMKSQDLNNLLYGAQLLKTGKMSGYTMQAEKDADRTAVAYLAKSPYKAEGILSFMRKLDEKSDANPTESLGIYQDHPAPFRRVASIAKAMKEEGIDVDLRKARGITYAKTVPARSDDCLYEVTIGKKVIYSPAGLGSGPTSSKARSDALAAAINKMLDSGITHKDVTADATGYKLLLRGTEVLKIESADAALMGEDKPALLKQARGALEYAIWADWLCDRCPVVQKALAEESD